MNKQQVIQRILDVGIVPSVRLHSTADALFAAEAVTSSGVPIVEVTMTIPGALQVIAELTRHNPDVLVGAGTVLTREVAEQCLEAGAGFLTSPALIPAVVELARQHHVTVIPGAVTPTEVLNAWNLGADFVKIFPSAQMGGPGYIRALRAPLPHIPLIASGGVNQHNVGEFILAGASAVGIGTDLIHDRAITRRERDWIRELAGRYVTLVQRARRQAVPESSDSGNT
jgi:2-dehydro-3-deoxyphosphogluconate aldolase/(4S)-4-hydroxy-2-oxoglutarate aldolase